MNEEKLSEIVEIYNSIESPKGIHNVEKALHNEDIDIIGSGSTRVVFTVDENHVIKFCSPKANKNEVELYNNASEYIKDLLCPVVEYADDYSWLVMKKAEVPKNTSRRLAIRDEVEEMLSKAKKHWLDSHSYNSGIYNDKPVVIDYADEKWL